MPKAILIADDDPEDVEIAIHALKEANLLNPVNAVHNGVAVISYLRGDGIYADRTRYPFPGILLLDLKMPQQSGIEVLEWIRTRPEHRELVVIAVTGVRNVWEMTRAFQLGARSFLLKPFKPEKLLDLLPRLNGIRLQSRREGQYLDFDPTLLDRIAPSHCSL